MGLLGNSLLTDEQSATKIERDKLNELKKKQEEDRLALKQRGSGMQGGGRQGLMFNQNQSGVA